MDVNDKPEADTANATMAPWMPAWLRGDEPPLRAMLHLSVQPLSAQSNGVLITYASLGAPPIISVTAVGAPW